MPPDYEIICRLGSGSFAEVWLARAPGGIDVALKCIIYPIEREEAKRELQAMELVKQLRHPFLLQIHRFWIYEDKIYIEMELMEGTLRDRLKQCQEQGLNAIPLPELLSLMSDAAEALDYIHSQDLIHRDIKPDNLGLLQGHAKVADLGLARMLPKRPGSISDGVGTPRYMPPELWDNKLFEVSYQVDQYSLAMTYVELRRGRPSFADPNLMTLMVAHLTEQPDLDGLAEAEQAVVLRALAKNPAERFNTCTDFVQALYQANFGLLPDRLERKISIDNKLLQPPGLTGTPSGPTSAIEDSHHTDTHNNPKKDWRDSIFVHPRNNQNSSKIAILICFILVFMCICAPIVLRLYFEPIRPTAVSAVDHIPDLNTPTPCSSTNQIKSSSLTPSQEKNKPRLHVPTSDDEKIISCTKSPDTIITKRSSTKNITTVAIPTMSTPTVATKNLITAIVPISVTNSVLQMPSSTTVEKLPMTIKHHLLNKKMASAEQPVIITGNKFTRTTPIQPVDFKTPSIDIQPSLAPPSCSLGESKVWGEIRHRCTATDTLLIICRKYYQDEKFAESLLIYNRIHPLASQSIKNNPPILANQSLYIPHKLLLQEIAMFSDKNGK